MDITNVKAMVAKVFTIGALAGAVVLATPSKAQAQVSFGIHFGTPVRHVYVAPSYGYVQPTYGYGYAQPAYSYGYVQPRYGDRYEDRREGYERHEAMEQRERHEDHERAERRYNR